jgi:TetR/AcrR family transcriptional regulator, transcriptional repressor for nem operon
MRKGDKTRETILERAAELFNSQGYAGASLADIMQATGLQKGGIYNHFESKDDLAAAAFEYAFNLASQRMVEMIRGTRGIDRLFAIIRFFDGYYENPPVRGGCVLLNTAIESDDANPRLRERARYFMGQWRDLIRRTVEKGISLGEIRPEIDGDTLATVIISTVEGAIMLSKLYDEAVHIDRAVAHLCGYVEQNVRV